MTPSAKDAMRSAIPDLVKIMLNIICIANYLYITLANAINHSQYSFAAAND